MMQNTQLLIRRYGETDFITGLRAIAALLVVMIHTGAWNDLGAIGQAITSSGKYGVDMFFVISGFTIAKTIQDAPTYQHYLTRRLWRILPLYYLTITLVLCLWAWGGLGTPIYLTQLGAQADIYNWLIHLSLLSYLDYTQANSILGVEWSIPIEVFWYVCLPFLLVWAKTKRRILTLLFTFLLLKAVLAYLTKKAFGTSLPNSWLPTSYGYLFLLGALSFEWRKRYQGMKKTAAQRIITVSVITSIISICLPISLKGEIIGLTTLALLTLHTESRAPKLNSALTSRWMLFLGSISYSIYLFHFVIDYVLRQLGLTFETLALHFLLVVSTTTAISVVSYVFVERKTNQIGKRIASKRHAP